MENRANAPRYRVSAKSWILTWPDCGYTKAEVRDLLQSKGPIIKGGLISRGPLGLAAYITLEERFNCRHSHFWDLGPYHGTYQAARSFLFFKEYISKQGDLLEFGDSSWTKEDPFTVLGKRHFLEEAPTPVIRGLWIWGPPGSGKTHSVHAMYPGLYNKTQNKYWDGYAAQKTVLLDDLDHQGEHLFHYLKIWADKWPIQGETRVGQTPLTHARFIVTSLLSIDEVFKNIPALARDSLTRRFRQIHKATMLDEVPQIN